MTDTVIRKLEVPDCKNLMALMQEFSEEVPVTSFGLTSQGKLRK